MIRDFCGISKKTLLDEIKELRRQLGENIAPPGVSNESADAIDLVRGVGNIGAHMEKNIDHIVPVEPEEAQLLIELVETLFSEWYVERQRRFDRLENIKALSESKARQISDFKIPQIEAPK